MMWLSYLWHHIGLECCDIINMPWYGVMAPNYYECICGATAINKIVSMDEDDN